ncbi:MAG: DUF1292 domain-containing protein [Eggerthellaceae bacterium]|nr:DUF1292 domain-containing protein [Eggerthellaceae bacterium]
MAEVRKGSHPDFSPPAEEGIILVFQDESGDTVNLEFLGLLNMDSHEYGFFYPVDEDHPALSSGEVLVLEVLELDDEGIPESFELVDDENLANAAYSRFKDATKDMYRFE